MIGGQLESDALLWLARRTQAEVAAREVVVAAKLLVSQVTLPALAQAHTIRLYL